MDKTPNRSLLLVASILVLLLFVFTTSFLLKTKEYAKINKNLLATAGLSLASVTVANVLPVASSPSLNGGSTIHLTENTTTPIAVTGIVTDDNSCQDLTAVAVAVYKDGAACGSYGDANNDTCYYWATTTPAQDSSCTGPSDTTYAVNHTFDIKYLADPGNWYTTITPVDTIATGTPATSTPAVTLEGTQAISVTPTIGYGSVPNGATSTGDHIATTTNTGNIATNFTVQGNDLTCIGAGTIPTTNEQYASSSFSYNVGGTVLSSTTPANVGLTLGAPSIVTDPVAGLTYWHVSVPYGVSGTCSGNIAFDII